MITCLAKRFGAYPSDFHMGKPAGLLYIAQILKPEGWCKVARRGVAGDPDADRVLRQFGADIRAARAAAGLTQARVSEQAGVTQRTVSLAEQGQRNLRWSVMYALARAVGCRLRLVFAAADDADAQQGLRQFGENLRAARQAAGLTQARVGEQAGVTHRTVSYAEQGQRNLRWSVMYALACATGHRLELVLGPADRNPNGGKH
jgi:transcriptional regulator with XRE-family HTH domain